MRLLIVEDEADMRKLLSERLQNEGYAVDTCSNGVEAVEYLSLGDYDGAIVDIMLPKLNGFQVLKAIREKKIYTPFMFLSALNDNEDIVKGLDGGADDYLTKPFDFDVLLARVRVMLRKTVGVHENVYRCGDLVLKESEMEAYRENEKIDLTAREFNILLFLVRNEGRVLTREQIISSAWNDGEELTSNVVDVYIRFLRKKIDDPYEKKLIQTIRGIGYCLKDEKE
ncbi:MAG: response regulator transcription factor [Butyrivibrio sp.]|nr:response regulator transcription factor [Butyrivibrio sp.]